MSNTLTILNNFTATINGNEYVAKQGLAAAAIGDSQAITITGLQKIYSSQLATATIVVAYDDSYDTPTDFAYLHYWADQTTYLNLLTSATQVTFKLGAYIPFSFGGFNKLVATAANVTAITGGAEPTATDIKKIVIGNYSGNTVNYTFAVLN